jgi:sugar lactone lactonase YvrE
MASLYCFENGQLRRVAGDITTSNGLAWSPQGTTMYWSDTKAHTVRAFDFDVQTGALARGRHFACFPGKPADGSLAGYGGRPDGAAVDLEGAYWVAMFEGQQLLRLSPDGAVLQTVPLPVRCATMPCFGGDDGHTLFITTARQNRPANELASQPWAGCVLSMRVPVAGLPTQFAQL